MASILSLNLNGRFRSGTEAHRIGQAVLQRVLRGVDIFLGQQAQFQPCLPGNYRMIGHSSAFIVYNCQLYSATELHHIQCLVHSRFSELPPSNWTASRIFFEQTCQEVLVISWFTDDAIRSKKKKEALLKRVLGAAIEFSSSFGVPFVVGGSFNLSAEEADLVLQESGLTDVRCYGYWLDSVRRGVRASSLFFCLQPGVELNHVRPRSLSGNICLGYRNDNWVNPEDSFYWDPLAAKITLTTPNKVPQIFTSEDEVQSSSPDPVAAVAGVRVTRRRQNFDVIRTATDGCDANTSRMVATLSNFALGLKSAQEATSSSSQGGDQELSRYTNPALDAISQTSRRRQTTDRETEAPDGMTELREILTRLRVGREVQVVENETKTRQSKRSVSLDDDYNIDVLVDDRMGLTQEDLERMSSGQYSRKLSTISESGESSCSSFRVDDDGASLNGSNCLELEDYTSTRGPSTELSKFRNNWKNDRESVEGQTDESAEERDGGGGHSSTVTLLSSKQSSQDERIVEGSSDIDQDDGRPAGGGPLFGDDNRVVKEDLLRSNSWEERVEKSCLAIKSQAELSSSNESSSSTFEFIEQDNNFDSNFSCILM